MKFGSVCEKEEETEEETDEEAQCAYNRPESADGDDDERKSRTDS